jgi:hypothetical protein
VGDLGSVVKSSDGMTWTSQSSGTSNLLLGVSVVGGQWFVVGHQGTILRGTCDSDGDSYSSEIDCDDHDSSTYPGAPELCDGKDNDCDGVVPADEADADADGFRACQNDCRDDDPAVNPDAVELPGNLQDENCDGSLGDCDPTAPWRNHGHFVRCVAHEVEALVEAGHITEEHGDALIRSAAQSDVGQN